MQLVWDFVKCWNFPKQDFRTFRELLLIDTRIVPSYLALSCNNASRFTRWSDNYTQANVNAPGTAGGVQSVVTHSEKFDPAACNSHAAIETGVRVFSGKNPKDVANDAVCLAPGCYYDGSQCTQ